MDDNETQKGLIRNKRFIGFLVGAAVGFAVLYFFAQSLGFVDDRAISVGIFGAAAGGVGGRIGARWGTKGALLGIAIATLGAVVGTYFSYLITITGG